MFSKECPWCNEKINPSRLGQRLSKKVPKWYGFTKYVSVCPHCGGVVKQKGQAWIFLLFGPLLGAVLFKLVAGDKSSFEESDLYWLVIGMAVVGFVASFFPGRLEKAHDP